MSSRDEAGSPNRREEGSNAGCLALQSGEEVTKRGYFVHNNDEDLGGFAVVATTAKEAKKIVYDAGEIMFADTDYIAIRARWQRDAVVDDLPIGMVTDLRLGLLRGIYGSLMEYPCDECGKDADVVSYNGRVLCSCCIEEIENDQRHGTRNEKGHGGENR